MLLSARWICEAIEQGGPVSLVSLWPLRTPCHLLRSVYIVTLLGCAGAPFSWASDLSHQPYLTLFPVTVTALCDNSSGLVGGCSVPPLNSLAFSTAPTIQGSHHLVKWALVLVESLTWVKP